MFPPYFDRIFVFCRLLAPSDLSTGWNRPWHSKIQKIDVFSTKRIRKCSELTIFLEGFPVFWEIFCVWNKLDFGTLFGGVEHETKKKEKMCLQNPVFSDLTDRHPSGEQYFVFCYLFYFCLKCFLRNKLDLSFWEKSYDFLCLRKKMDFGTLFGGSKTRRKKEQKMCLQNPVFFWSNWPAPFGGAIFRFLLFFLCLFKMFVFRIPSLAPQIIKMIQ